MKTCYFTLKFCKKLQIHKKCGVLLLFLGCSFSIGSVDKAEGADTQLDLDCSLALQSSTDLFPHQMNQMFSQVERILNQVQVTPINKDSIKAVHISVDQWKKKQESLEIETLLQFAHFFNVLPSVLLSSGNLASHIHLEKLSSRSYLPEQNVLALIKVFGLHLKTQIEEFEHEFTLDIGEPVGLKDLAEMMEVELDLLDRIKSFLFVPDLSQLARILNIGSSIIIFFEEVESSDDFKTHLTVDDFISTNVQESDFSDENQMPGNISHRLIEAIDASGIEVERLRPLLGHSRNTLLNLKDPYFSLIIKVSHITRHSVKDIISGNISQDTNVLSGLTRKKEGSRDMYIDKAKKVILYLIKLEIKQQKISIQELAEKSQVPMTTIQSLLTYNQNLRYFTLFKIVEDGFGIPLANFLEYENEAFSSLEELIEEFNTIDFDVDVVSI